MQLVARPVRTAGQDPRYLAGRISYRPVHNLTLLHLQQASHMLCLETCSKNRCVTTLSCETCGEPTPGHFSSEYHLTAPGIRTYKQPNIIELSNMASSRQPEQSLARRTRACAVLQESRLLDVGCDGKANEEKVRGGKGPTYKVYQGFLSGSVFAT